MLQASCVTKNLPR